ncbi:Cnl2/NKP2 family protein-domain-containing protein [Podospora fimiseda]|uniref:Cnl2/NKP2 family protein-domain-containing protein n=1 Tax=Podospora fimiseda TaxID=252190 RepID=A0AAN7H086_9PEZI|nr:Cnl2/NKP2 family protein-domain-containing protein [Podospora fimiseda]
MPPPTESQILTSYLLLPAQLPSIISLQEFTSLFPKSIQSSCPQQIRSLYRDFQSQRNSLIDQVTESIADETKKSKAIRRHVLKAHHSAQEEQDDELEIERMLGSVPKSQTPKHSLETIIPGLEDAINELESQLQLHKEEEAALLAQLKQTVGTMSDLRYGRLANPKLPGEILEGLADLQETCKEK